MMLQKAKSDRFLGGFFALAVSSTLLGVFAGWILPDFLSFEHYLHSLVAWVRGGARSVGIAIIGLAPLSIWVVRLLFLQFVRDTTDSDKLALDYAFIARNATLMGLLGTVVALASAGTVLSREVSEGSAAAILAVIPLVGQALISTIAGIVIAIFADSALHIHERCLSTRKAESLLIDED